MSKPSPRGRAGPADPSRRRLFQAAGATGVAVAIPLAKVAEAADNAARGTARAQRANGRGERRSARATRAALRRPRRR